LSIRFELFQAKARHVFLAGSFNGWREDATPMSDSGGGHWMVDVPLSPGRYEYRFLVDGDWVTDPVAARYAANPFGGLNAIIHI
jgi:1,4-alpha-glucan branching enzyme